MIVFSGRCKDHAHNTLPLFSSQQLLFDAGTNKESYAILDRGLASSGKVELPFEFRFPSKVEIAPGERYQPRPGFEHEEGHLLPTSMIYGDNRVEYVLEVAVYKRVDWSPDEVIKLTLPFRPTAAVVTSNALVQCPEHSDFYIRGRHLKPGSHSNPSALTKLKWAALSKYQHGVPEARWRIKARCPFLLISGAAVPISFDFDNLGCSPELQEAPEVYIRRVRVKLTSLLAVRVPYGGPFGEREVIDDIENIEREIHSQTFGTTNTLMRHGLQLSEIGEFVLPPTVLPSFRTYGLRLVYRIKVMVEGYAGQQTFRVTALRDYCKIVCDVRLRGRAAAIPTAGSNSRFLPARPAHMASATEEQLPSYEQAPSYADASPTGRFGSHGASSP